MYKLILTLLFIGLFVTSTYAQRGGMHKGQKRNNPTIEFKQNDEKSEEKKKEELTEKVKLFLNDLNVDDFQKEIIKQRLETYFVEFKKEFGNSRNKLEPEDREEQIEKFNKQHFKDIEEITTQDIQNDIYSFIKKIHQDQKDNRKNKESNKNKQKGKGKQNHY